MNKISWEDFEKVEIRVGKNISEVLVLGIPDGKGECVLIQPDKEVPLGGKLF